MASITKRMKAYQSITGIDIIGFSYADLVDQMALDKMVSPKSRRTYREATARRINSTLKGCPIDPSTDKRFIESMVRVGQLTPIN